MKLVVLSAFALTGLAATVLIAEPKPSPPEPMRGRLPRTPTFSTHFGDRQEPRGQVRASIKLCIAAADCSNVPVAADGCRTD